MIPSRNRYAKLSKPLLVLAALCLTALVSYKAGQWSVERTRPFEGERPAVIETNSTSVQDTEEAIARPAINSTTEMPGNGKYSVG